MADWTRASADTVLVLNAIKAGMGAYCHNATTDAVGDILKAGNLDATKTTRLALQNAAIAFASAWRKLRP
jgi:chaperonin GroEL (HSP60 family)